MVFSFFNKFFLLLILVFTFASAISFVSPTPSNDTYTNSTFIFVNVTTTGSENLSGVLNFTYNLYNSNGLISSVNTTSSSYNFTGLSDQNYTFNVIFEDNSTVSFSESRIVVIDTTTPVVSYISPTLSSGTLSPLSSLFINLSLVESNIGNINYILSQNGSVVSSGSSTNSTYNFTGIADGNYSFWVVVTDLAGNSATAPSRNVTISGSYPILGSQNVSTDFYNVSLVWSTNVPTTSVMFYGTNPDSFSLTTSDSITSTSHYAHISSLDCGTTYYYNFTDCTVSGNCLISGVFTFDTLACVNPTVIFINATATPTPSIVPNATITPTPSVTVNVTPTIIPVLTPFDNSTSISVNFTENDTLINYQHVLQQDVNITDVMTVEFTGLSCADYNAGLISFSTKPDSVTCGSIVANFSTKTVLSKGDLFNVTLTVRKILTNDVIKQLEASTFLVSPATGSVVATVTPTTELPSQSSGIFVWILIVAVILGLLIFVELRKK
ncbi:Uncharacterised protein [uncultured archaeon]|nr:Uncharacterised protein [uncultured archaeon]